MKMTKKEKKICEQILTKYEQDSGKVETTLNDYAAISAYRLKAEENLELAKELEQRFAEKAAKGKVFKERVAVLNGYRISYRTHKEWGE